MVNADDICNRYRVNSVGLDLRLLDNDRKSSMVVIQGPPDALKMLGELLIAMAADPRRNSFTLSPTGSGRFHFKRGSKLGLFIQRLKEE